MPPSIHLALALAVLGAFLLYAGSPNQRLSARGRRPLLLALGAAGLLMALPLLLGWFGPATAVFVWMTVAMLVWSIVPLGVAWWRRPRKDAR